MMSSPQSTNDNQNQQEQLQKRSPRSKKNKDIGGTASKEDSPQTLTVEREAMFANRGNSDFKWQRSKYVVGALEVKSEPFFDPREDMVPRYKDGVKEIFQEALQAWEDLKLCPSFIEACDELPAEACCCGLIHDQDASIKRHIQLLNEKWVKTTANKKLQPFGIKMDLFLWSWQNASGKAETNIMLIRFFQTSTYKFRRATNDTSLNLGNIVESEDKEQPTKKDDDTEQVIPNNTGEEGVQTQEMAR